MKKTLHRDGAVCGIEPAPPCTLVVFGAAGDLTKRLLMPALYNLSGSGLLPRDFQILGIDHNAGSDESLRAALTTSLEALRRDPSSEFHADRIDPEQWGVVRERIRFQQGDFAAPETFETLRGRVSGSIVFYLAVAPRFFGPIVEGLGHAGLLRQAGGAFRRVIVEKPFGSDLASARALNARILMHADESQFYRIDHFLGKETVQSILAIRFANAMLEPIWRRGYVDSVQITAAETVGVEGRGGFYEPTGALRDMVPNHLFQLLCMVAMEPPGSAGAEAVRGAKSELALAVAPIRPEDAVRGQYAAGSLDGRPVPGYRSEPDVAPDSDTETYVALKLAIANARWAGVPFYLRTGKRLARRRTEIAILFKPAPFRLFEPEPGPDILRLTIDPEHGTSTEVNVKVPGPRMRIGRVRTAFRYADFFADPPDVGYETLIYDCMTGDTTLFQRADTIEAGWAAVEPMLTGERSAPEIYPAGSAGPEAADALLARDGRRWLGLDGETP